MGTVIKDIMMRYLWREVKEKFRDDVDVCGSQTFIRVSFPIITVRVVDDQSSLHRLAFLRIAGPPCLPGFS